MKFVFDLDGTICFKGRPVSETILRSLEELGKQGHEVVFASARPIRDLLPVLDERFHRHWMVGGNGSMVAKDGEVLWTASFDKNILSEILHIIEEFNATYLIDSDWNYTYTGPSDHPILPNLDPERRAKNVPLSELGPMMKILLLTSDNMKEVEKRLGKLDVVINVHGDEGVLDISPRGIDKWSGLGRLGIRDGEFVAFGNDANDIAMFQHAKHAVMIGDYPALSPYATEKLPLDENVEETIAEKIVELGKTFMNSMV